MRPIFQGMFFVWEKKKPKEKLHVQEKDLTDLPDYGKPVEMPQHDIKE